MTISYNWMHLRSGKTGREELEVTDFLELLWLINGWNQQRIGWVYWI